MANRLLTILMLSFVVAALLAATAPVRTDSCVMGSASGDGTDPIAEFPCQGGCDSGDCQTVSKPVYGSNPPRYVIQCQCGDYAPVQGCSAFMEYHFEYQGDPPRWIYVVDQFFCMRDETLCSTSCLEIFTIPDNHYCPCE